MEKNDPRVQMMNYHLAEFYFRTENFTEAANRYEQTNIANLSNREIADMKFHQGYSYFTLQRFAAAKPLFNSIRSIKDDPNYLDANYYYGFLAFRDRQYRKLLKLLKWWKTKRTTQQWCLIILRRYIMYRAERMRPSPISRINCKPAAVLSTMTLS